MSQSDETYDYALTPGRAAGVRVWDVPTRLFKWSLVGLIVAAWLSTYLNDPAMNVHKLAGYGILTLVIYRLLWGFVGGSTARFASFVRSPAQVIAYLRAVRAKRAKPYLGHNPAGGLMILALLFACGVQALLGLFASDGVLASGPLADAAGDRLSSWAAQLHGLWVYVILGLALVHIAANLYAQLVKRENLIGAMITGRKKPAAYQDAKEAEPGSLVAAALCLLVAATIVYFVVTVAGGGWFGET